MLNFFRLFPVNYIVENQHDCISEAMADSCRHDMVYKMPVMPGDEIRFMVLRSEVLYSGYDDSDIRIGLTNCGVLVEEDNNGNDIKQIGTAVPNSSETHLYCTIIVPDVPDCENYELLFYVPYTPVDPTLLPGITWDELCALNIKWGDLCTVTFDNFC